MSQPFDFEAGAQHARLNFLTGWLVTQETARPAWNPGDFFGELFGGSVVGGAGPHQREGLTVRTFLIRVSFPGAPGLEAPSSTSNGVGRAGGCWGSPGGKGAAAADAPKVIEVEKVKDNLFVLRGGGGNTAVFVMADGVAVVDAKNPGWGRPILDKIKELTPKPVTVLINTHTHGDHVSGNVDFPRR